MEMVTAPEPGTQQGPAPDQPWLVPLTVLIVGMFATVLDTTIVNVAIPSMQIDLGTSAEDIEWVVTAFNLALAITVPIVGWLSDRIGLSRLYIISISAFAAASVMCGLAWDLSSLVFFRILQAIPGGVLPVISMTMLYRIVPPAKIGTAMGIFGLGIIVGPAVGPTLGGYLIEHVDWRLIFYVNAPVGVIGAIAAIAVFPRIRPTSWPKFDLLGFVTVAYGLSAVLLAAAKGQKWGWTSYSTLILLISGVLSLAVFVVVELEVENPLLDVRVFRHWAYTNSLVMIAIMMVGLNAVLFYLPQFMQESQGLTALNAGITLLPEAMVLMVMMPLAGRIYDLFGARWPAVIGIAISTYGTYLLCGLSPDTTREQIMWWTSIRAVGLGLAMMPIMTSGLSGLPAASTAAGSAWNNVAQRLAGSLGLAAFGVVVRTQQNQLMVDRGGLLSATDSDVPGLSQAIDQGTGGVLGIYQQLQVAVSASAYADVFFVSTILTGAIIVLALMLPGKRKESASRPPQHTESEVSAHVSGATSTLESIPESRSETPVVREPLAVGTGGRSK